MPRIRNVLQHRAERFRSKQAQKKQLREHQSFPLSLAHDDRTGFTKQLIKPQMEPNGASSGSMYSLEAKDTHATAVETFSSGEENTAYSDENDYTFFKEHDRNMSFSEHDRSQLEDGGEFVDLAYEASREEKNSFRGHEFIDLVQESSVAKGTGVESSNYRSYEEDGHDIAPKDFAQPETIEFVDSDDGKVFNITQESIGHGVLLQHVRSLDDSNTIENDECSKTLNTNNETLESMPSLNDDDVAQMKLSHRFRNLQVDIREEEEAFEECDLEATTAYENGDYDEEASLAQVESQLYDCDDGEMYVPVGAPEDQQGTFFEQLRTVQSRHVNDYQAHHGPMGIVDEEVQPENWQSLSEQIHFENAQNSHLNRPVSPQLEDPYLSDGNSSWEEGSFATGASRTMSRVDTACDNYGDDDARTYDGTFNGTEYYSDDDIHAERNGDRPFVRLLKKLRNTNVDEEQSQGESSDEEEDGDYRDKKTRMKSKRKRRVMNKKGSGTIFESIREIGTDILDEAIEYAESQDRPDSRNQGGTIIKTFENLFSCGAHSEY